MYVYITKKEYNIAGHQWLIPVILASQEAEIRGNHGSKPAWATSSQDPILKKPITKKRPTEV
jgi:hypothetical protein